MDSTARETLEFLEENDIKFIRLAFCDIFGVQKNIAVMASQLGHALEHGVAFDASAIAGFGGVARSDLLLRPDLSTFTVLPWRPAESGVGLVFCNITYPDGRPFEGDGRWLLGQLEQRALRQGYSFLVGPECEFYLFETDEKGRPTHTPFDEAGYFDIAPLDKGENVRRQICLALEEMGVQPERSHHEQGPGQNEVDFRYSDPLSAADNAVTFLTVVKTIAARNGLYADFSPRPLEGRPGSGFHINMSVQGGAEALMHRAMGGILDKITDMTLFLNPTEQSYSRLGAHKAPKYISWSSNNRSQLIRVPAASGEYRRFELRSPDCTANPYLAFALLIWAGLSGIENDIALPEACNVNLHTADSRNVTLATLPKSLSDAEKCAADSNFIAQHLPQSLIEFFTK